MGIKNLLPNLTSVTRVVHLSSYSGTRAGVDAMSWLHRALHASHSNDIVALAHAQRNKSTNVASAGGRLDHGTVPPATSSSTPTAIINFVISRCELLKSHSITPVLVIDGAPLPSKAATDAQRALDRDECYSKAQSMESSGDSSATDVKKMYARSVSVTASMRKALFDECARRGIACVIAPYEADAQLTFFARTLVVDFVITEDSDALPYGCPRVLFKLDSAGNAEEIEQRNVPLNEALSFKSWSHDMFVMMCVLSGCDYGPAVKGLGIVKAHKIVRVYRKPAAVISAVKQLFGKDVGEDFDQVFAKAFLTFQHQRVWNEESGRVEMLYDANFDDYFWRVLGYGDRRATKSADGVTRDELELVIPAIGETDFLGREISDELGRMIAQGEVNPVTGSVWEKEARRPEKEEKGEVGVGVGVSRVNLQGDFVVEATAGGVEKSRKKRGGGGGDIRDFFGLFEPQPVQPNKKKERAAGSLEKEKKREEGGARGKKGGGGGEGGRGAGGGGGGNWEAFAPSFEQVREEYARREEDEDVGDRGDDGDMRSSWEHGGGEPAPHTVADKKTTTTTILHQIPIQSNEYSSILVGGTFETLARRRRREGAGSGSGGGGDGDGKRQYPSSWTISRGDEGGCAGNSFNDYSRGGGEGASAGVRSFVGAVGAYERVNREGRGDEAEDSTARRPHVANSAPRGGRRGGEKEKERGGGGGEPEFLTKYAMQGRRRAELEEASGRGEERERWRGGEGKENFDHGNRQRGRAVASSALGGGATAFGGGFTAPRGAHSLAGLQRFHKNDERATVTGMSAAGGGGASIIVSAGGWGGKFATTPPGVVPYIVPLSDLQSLYGEEGGNRETRSSWKHGGGVFSFRGASPERYTYWY